VEFIRVMVVDDIKNFGNLKYWVKYKLNHLIILRKS